MIDFISENLELKRNSVNGSIYPNGKVTFLFFFFYSSLFAPMRITLAGKTHQQKKKKTPQCNFMRCPSLQIPSKM